MYLRLREFAHVGAPPSCIENLMKVLPQEMCYWGVSGQGVTLLGDYWG